MISETAFADNEGTRTSDDQ